MSFFGDILDDHDKRLDFDHKEPFKLDDIKTSSIKVKAAPAKNVVSIIFFGFNRYFSIGSFNRR